ncbi:MAG: ATP-binding cassette domain-containing protein, partial [Desulfobulbaceae bacterium]|nr:ATP-binding cassette domain-containing protein [Desulfobulbaceae bacterium]
MQRNKDQAIALQATGLIKLYKSSDRPALDGFNIKIGVGDIFGLLGPNGAGKTTAISIMSTLLRATDGSVTIYGADNQQQAGKIAEMIGLVPQEIALYRQLT